MPGRELVGNKLYRMILQVTLRHSYFGGDADVVFYIGPDELDAGADIASHIGEPDRALLSPFTANYTDDGHIEIICRDMRQRFPVEVGGLFNGPCVYRPSRAEHIEGETYDNDHEICVTLRLLPLIQYFSEKNPELDCSNSEQEIEHGAESPDVLKYAVLNEWDSLEEKPLRVCFDSMTLKRSETDAEAAYRIAAGIQEQFPEALEVIAEYMTKADKLGSSDAEEWLKDWYNDDGRFDAYC